jgi:hypothetical protein
MEVMPTRKPPTRPTAMAPLLGVIHLGRCSRSDFLPVFLRYSWNKASAGVRIRTMPIKIFRNNGAGDTSYRHSEHEIYIHKTAMVVGPSRTDFGHSDEKRSRSDRDDGRDMYQ